MVSQVFKLHMKPAECKLHKNLSTVSDHGVAAFRKLFRELKYLLCTVTRSLLWTIFCEFYYDCRLWMSLLWSLLLLIKSIFSISVPQSILLELQWLFPEIICSKQLLRLQPCQYHWSCGICSGICRCWDWRGTGLAMLENLALRSCSNEGTDSAEVGGWLWMCAHTLPTSMPEGSGNSPPVNISWHVKSGEV